MSDLTREHFDASTKLVLSEVRTLAARVGAVEGRVNRLEQHGHSDSHRRTSELDAKHHSDLAGVATNFALLVKTNFANQLSNAKRLSSVEDYLQQVHAVIVDAHRPWWRRHSTQFWARTTVMCLLALFGAYLGGRP